MIESSMTQNENLTRLNEHSKLLKFDQGVKMEYIPVKCGLCGACVVVCPVNILELDENGIDVGEGCEECSKCLEVCPLGAITPGDALK